MADIVSFGMAPAILAFGWGLSSLGRLGWTAAFLFVAAAALRLARFNVQAGSADKRYFIGMPSPAAAGIVAATVYAYPAGFSELHCAAPLGAAGGRAGGADGQHHPLPQLQEHRHATPATRSGC